jgi:DNA helicase II / ATP-dependent DNA helicase PcrA
MAVEPRWKKCERAWGIWLQQQGWHVTPSHLFTGNVQNTQAPLIQLADGRGVIAPDYLVNRGGVHEYWDVKYRSFREVSMYNGEEYFWISSKQLSDYFYLRNATGINVKIVIYDNSQFDETKRWLITDIYTIHQHGRQIQVIDHTGQKYITAMSIPLSILKVSNGPIIDRSAPEVVVSSGPIISAQSSDDNISNKARLHQFCQQLQLPITPRYSLVWFGERHLETVLELMHFGIRVFLITHRASPIQMQNTLLHAFIEARFLEWSIDPSLDPHLFGGAIDGHWFGERKAELPALFASAGDYPGTYGSGINVMQYQIVHADIHEDVLVMAGAGTGKTETMAERLMFILTMNDVIEQTKPLSLKEIALITFTRDAAREMRSRIARTIVVRRRLAKYCVYPIEYWLNQLGKSQISTIHSFAKKIIQQFGGLVGIAPDVHVSQRLVERRRFIYRQLSTHLEKLYAQNPSIPAVHEWVEHIESVWDTLDNNGVNIQDNNLNWGQSQDVDQQIVISITKDVITAAHVDFLRYCNREHVLPMNQLVMLAQQALHIQSQINASTRSMYRYLFVDEFQDTDELQLDMVLLIRELFSASLFIVGDVKQGVYRFRGASGDAFDALRQAIQQRELSALKEFPLTRNYRTDGKLLDSMHPCFLQWGKEKLLVYDESTRLLPQHSVTKKGIPIESMRLTNPKEYASHAAEYVEQWRNKKTTDSIAIICRSNYQAIQVQQELRRRGQACELLVGGTFYQSPVVRELAVFMAAIINPNDDATILQLCETRWIGKLVRPHDMSPHDRCDYPEAWQGDIVAPLGWNSRFMSLAQTHSFERDDLRPIKQRLISLRSLNNHMSTLSFIVKCKSFLSPELCTTNQSDDETERHRYARGFVHLMTLIDTQFADSSITLTSLLNWLKIQIATNTNEDEPMDLDDDAMVGKTYALTVHKSKGLEFDFVLIPHTWAEFDPPKTARTDSAVIRAQSVQSLIWRWQWNPMIKIDNTDGINWQYHISEVTKEEARLLYVAMTRAKHRLLILRPPSYRDNKLNWSQLLSKGGI